MDQSVLNDFIPPLIFFIIFFLVFTLLEFIVVLFLNNLEKKNWEWLIDVLIRSEVHHKKIVRFTVMIVIGALIILFISFTPLVRILTTESDGFRIFALLLGLVMLLFFMVNIRKATKIRIEKKIYGLAFLVISLIFYLSVIILAHESYSSYADYVNSKIIRPAVKGVENVIEEKEKASLIQNARNQYLANRCQPVDYTKGQKQILMENIQFLANDQSLVYGNGNTDLQNPEGLKGMACSDGENTLLLTENGNWYLVSEEYINFVK